MTRQEKFPDTSSFHYYNANPKGKYTGDCVIRAIATASKISYEDVLNDLVKYQLKTGYAYDDPKCYGKYLEANGWSKHPQPRKSDNTKVTGKEFCEELLKFPFYKRIIAHIGGHHMVAIIDCQVNDIWDSTDGCVGNYWTKGVKIHE